MTWSRRAQPNFDLRWELILAYRRRGIVELDRGQVGQLRQRLDGVQQCAAVQVDPQQQHLAHGRPLGLTARSPARRSRAASDIWAFLRQGCSSRCPYDLAAELPEPRVRRAGAVGR